MTLIIYVKCVDGIIVILDRKESDFSSFGQITKKYHLPANQEFLLALAGDSDRIETIVSALISDSIIDGENIRQKLSEIIHASPNFGGEVKSSEGLLLIKNQNSFQFHNVRFTNTLQVIIDQNPEFRCYGDGAQIADYLIRKFNPQNFTWKKAIHYLISLMQEVAERIPSVGKIDEFGFDVIVIRDDGKLQSCTISDDYNINEIDFNFPSDESTEIECLSDEQFTKIEESKPIQVSKEADEQEEEKSKKILSESISAEELQKLATEGDLPLVVQTDKSVYMYGSDMIVTIINPYFESNTSIELEIKDQTDVVIFSKKIPVKKEANGIYQEIIDISGEDWSTPGGEYSINAKYLEKTSSVIVFRSDFGINIELDKLYYSWTDKVYITVVAPDLILDPTKINLIGDSKDILIKISTKHASITGYKLVETGIDSGIFTGEITLTGFNDHNLKDKNLSEKVRNISKGTGPTDGLLSCSNDDWISVTLITPTKTVTSSAVIRWNLGEISWLKSTYPVTGEGEIRIVDPDMNLDPDLIDIFKIRVKSDTNPEGIELDVIETGNDTGIFKGTVSFTTEKSSDSLQVSEGDKIVAEYIDRTLPAPHSITDELTLTSEAMIGALSAPIERVKSSNIRLQNEFGELVTEPKLGEPVNITADLKNLQDEEQSFAYFVQILDEDEITISTSWISGIFVPNQSLSPSISWKPEKSGKYSANVFVWQSVDNPSALSAPLELTFEVKDKVKQKIELTKLEPKGEKFPENPMISIPPGSSVPGCEEDDKCFIPSQVSVKINQTVIWKNDDTAAHTITSGTPDEGPDGIFDSSMIMAGKSFAHKFKKRGRYPYFCMLHPWQIGNITVD